METPQPEISALSGILDEGMASAAAQLSGLLNESISLKVAHLAISPLEQVLPLLVEKLVLLLQRSSFQPY